jgi:hypothetical protein
VLQALVLKLKPPQLPTSQKLAVDVIGKAFTNTLNQQSVKDRMSRFSLFTTGQAIPTLSLCSKNPCNQIMKEVPLKSTANKPK